jgi:hypothetical protein
MAKLIGFEKTMVSEGIKMYADALKQDVKIAEVKGKVHIFSEEYVDMIVNDIESKLKLNTQK